MRLQPMARPDEARPAADQALQRGQSGRTSLLGRQGQGGGEDFHTPEGRQGPTAPQWKQK